jgi:hypothetical protein
MERNALSKLLRTSLSPEDGKETMSDTPTYHCCYLRVGYISNALSNEISKNMLVKLSFPVIYGTTWTSFCQLEWSEVMPHGFAKRKCVAHQTIEFVAVFFTSLQNYVYIYIYYNILYIYIKYNITCTIWALFNNTYRNDHKKPMYVICMSINCTYQF